MGRRECELVEVVLDGLDFTVVADLVAEAEERILDDPPYLRDRMQVADRELFARKRDVDDLLAEPAVELGFLDHPLTFRDRGFEALADPVQEDAALAVAGPPRRLCQLA